MKDIRTLHNEAMDLALQGDLTLESNPTGNEHLQYYTKAFEKEREAALLADFVQNPEPGLSILFRSAASLAIQCGFYREAEQLIAKALSGNPSHEIASELRELLQSIYAFSQHDEDVLVYQLEIPIQERARFETILSEFGLSPSTMRRVNGNLTLP